MTADQIHRPALSEASSRGNTPQARPVGQKPADAVSVVPSFAELMAMSNTTHRATPSAPAVSAHSLPNVAAAANAPKTTAATGAKKRKAETTLEKDIAAYKRNLDDTVSPDAFGDEPLPSCDAVRGRINKLLDCRIMTKAEFARAIGGKKPATLNRFLQASGPMGGSASSVHHDAWAWFRQREVAGLKMPDVVVRKRRKQLEAATTSAPPLPLPDISGIYLPGEETDSVPVFDTCDEVRRKIDAHLRTPGLTQSQFCRDLYAQLRAPRWKGIQAKQLADFGAMEGARNGARSTVFYAAYVYFEKLRLARGEPKSAHRETMEALWGGCGGFDREQQCWYSYDSGDGTTLIMDQYGMARFC
ncbi:hypothetical protein F5Y14DRAFT_416047 [Nemania sp. NC0429]|nr:hypothetical protein F5Y14DRAFT_416047 [Nemania sp. NC0429]